MDKELSVEEYQHMVASGQLKTQRPDYTKPALIAGSIVVALVLGFIGGISYQKGKTPNTQIGTTTGQFGTQGTNGQNGFRGMRRSGSFGSVTAVSDNSITVDSQRTGGSETFKITSSTTVTDNGSSASVSDIKVGDTVMIRTSTSDTSTATSILLNPSFGGGPGVQDNSSSSDSTSDSTIVTN